MPNSRLESRLRDLEPLQADERGLRADISARLDKVTRAILAAVSGR